MTDQGSFCNVLVMGGKGNVLVFNGFYSVPVCKIRYDQLKYVLTSFPDVKIVEPELRDVIPNTVQSAYSNVTDMVFVMLLATGYSGVVGVGGGLGAALIVGILNAILITRLNISPFLATLGVLFIGQSTQQLATSGGQPIYLTSGYAADQFNAIARTDLFGVPTPVIVLVVVAVAVHVGGTGLLKRFDGEPTVKLLKRAKELGRITTFDLIQATPETWKLVEPCLPYIDYFVPSIDEAGEMAHDHSS